MSALASLSKTGLINMHHSFLQRKLKHISGIMWFILVMFHSVYTKKRYKFTNGDTVKVEKLSFHVQNDIKFSHTSMFIIAVVNTMKPTKIMNPGYASLLGGISPSTVYENSRMEKSRHDMIHYLIRNIHPYICG